jgi:xylan 1,4-beta-xylosidase
MEIRRLFASLLALVLLQAGAGSPGPAFAEGPLTATVRSDFASVIQGQQSMSGFLLSMTETRPPDSLVQPLQPRLIRHRNPDIYARAERLGARFELLLSDGWGYPRQNWLGNGPPYADFAKWEAFVREVADRNRGKEVYWDIWNEPDGGFWSGTRLQLFETYLRAYRVLRKELGADAMIGGPSITIYNRSYLAAFLEYCRANGCEVNFLSWHDNRSAGAADISTVADHLADARRAFVENPAYAGLRIDEIHVNEYLGRAGQYRPGDILAFLTYLERGRADAAAKSCWPDEAGFRNANCVFNTLDGILTPDSLQPRAAWWAYKSYADGVATRVSSVSSDPRIVALASRGSASPATAQVLIGYWQNGATPEQANLTLELENLSALPFVGKRKKILAKVSRIPSTGELPLSQPVPVTAERIKVRHGVARLELSGIPLSGAYVVTVSRMRD